MARSITFNKVVTNPDGSIEISYTSSVNGANNNIGFASAEMAKLDVLTLLDNDSDVVRLFLAWWIARNETLSNKNLVEGKTMTVDLSAANAIKVQ